MAIWWQPVEFPCKKFKACYNTTSLHFPSTGLNELCGNLLEPHLPRWADSFLSICFASVSNIKGTEPHGAAWGSWGLLVVRPALGFPTHFFHKFLVCLALLSSPVDAYNSLVRTCQKIAVDTKLPWHPSKLIQSTHSTLNRNCPTGGAWSHIQRLLYIYIYIYSHISQGPQPSRERLRERPRGIRPTSGAQCLQQHGVYHLACQPPTNLETHCALISLICQNDPAWPRKSVIYISCIMYGSQEQKDESSWQSHVFLVTFKFCLVWSFTLHSILWTLHCRYLYELFVHSTSAMNQASDSRWTMPNPSKSLQTIKQMKIHVPNDAIASLNRVGNPAGVEDMEMYPVLFPQFICCLAILYWETHVFNVAITSWSGWFWRISPRQCLNASHASHTLCCFLAAKRAWIHQEIFKKTREAN